MTFEFNAHCNSCERNVDSYIIDPLESISTRRDFNVRHGNCNSRTCVTISHQSLSDMRPK